MVVAREFFLFVCVFLSLDPVVWSCQQICIVAVSLKDLFGKSSIKDTSLEPLPSIDNRGHDDCPIIVAVSLRDLFGDRTIYN